MTPKAIKINHNTVSNRLNTRRALLLVLIAAGMCILSVDIGMAALNNGSGIYEIRGEVATGARSWDATNFPAFYYDFNHGIGTESLVVSAIYGSNISVDNLIYQTHTVHVSYEVYDHQGILVDGKSNYSIIDWQGERFVALNDNANKLSSIVFDHGRKKITLIEDRIWDIGNGYTLSTVWIDVKGNQVRLLLSKDGLEVDSAVINDDSAWVVTKSLAGETVPFFVVYVDGIFQGQIGRLVVLNHAWLISDNVTYVHTDDVFGNLTVRTVNSSGIVLKNHVQINLSKGSTPGIMNDLKFRVADSNTLRFYPFVVGDTYYAQGTIADGTYHWDAYNFAGFYFDLDENTSTESLDATVTGRNIDSGKLVYSTKPVTTYFEHDEWGLYEVIAFMAEKYFAGYSSGTFCSSDSVDLISDGQLSRVLINEDEKRLVYAGSALILEDGYTLNIVELDKDGDSVYITLTKDGSKVDDMVISSGKNYVYEKDLGSSEDVPIIAVHFDEIFQDNETSEVHINGIFQISDEYITINPGDTYGRMEVTSITGKEIKMQNSDSIYLYPDKNIPIMGQIQFKVADNDWQLRYCPFVEKQGLSTTINSPSKYSTFSQGDIIIFSAYAKGGVAPYSYSWTSDIDGSIGNKSRFVTSALSPGIHSITFSSRDTSGAINNSSISLTVEVKNRLECNGDTIYITGPQEEAITWNASNFRGFNYSTDGGPGTETLTIVPNTLHGPDIDRLIDPGNLVYTTSFNWREYPIHKDLGLYVNKSDDGHSTGYLNGKQYVAINGVPDKLATPIVEFDSNDVKILRTGDVCDIGRGFSLTAKQIDIEGDKVWIELNKNGMFYDDEIIDTGLGLQNRVWTYNKDVAGELDVPILSLYVSEIMGGTDTGTGYVQIKYLSLIDDNILQISPEDNFGNMELTSIMGNSLGFSNWIDLDLTPGSSPSMIMESMSFVTLDNLSSIEFYPSMVKDETPIYDMGGFISGNYSSLWNLSEGYTIALQEVGIKGEKAMFSLLYDGVIIDQKIMTERLIAPNNQDSNYQYIKNGTLIINATLDFVFRSQDSEIANLINVYQCSEVNGSVLLSNESHFFKSISPTGILWNLSEGYTLTMKDVSLAGDKAWFELSKNNLVLKDAILTEDSINTFIFTSGGDNISFTADTIYSRTDEKVVKISNVYQYSNVSGQLISDATHIYKTGDPVGMPWSLPDGYSLSMKDIDSEGERVWFELSRDGSILKEDVIKSGDMFFYASGSESFNCTVIGVMCGTMGDVVKIANVNLYSDIDGKLVQNGSKTYANTYPDGEIWQLPEGYSLNPRDIDKDENKIWLSLSKNDMVVKDEIINKNDIDADRWFNYYNSTGALVFSTHVDDVFVGQFDKIVILANTTQYSEINGMSLLQVLKRTLRAGITLNDTTTPVINNVINTDPTTDSVTITWNTDKDSDSVIRYGTTSDDYTNVEYNTTLVTSHNITLSGLSAQTTYYYVVNSTGASGNSSESSEYNFTTATIPPTTLPVVLVEDVTAAPDGYAFTSIMVNNVTDLGSGKISVTFDPLVVYVTNVTSGDGNALVVQDWNINNTAGSVEITAWDAYESHNGDVVFAHVTLHTLGEYPDSTPLDISSLELIDYTSYDSIGHIITNGTFRVSDNEPPVITGAIATPDVILNDNGRSRASGTNVTVLNATVIDSGSGVMNVTIDLSLIGGSSDQVMKRIAGTDVWTVATTATNGINLTHELVVTAIDVANNTNTSVIELTVLLRGDVVRDGNLNSADVLYIAKYLVGKESMPSLLVGDMSPDTGDGMITSADALYLAKYLVGKEAAP
ncbi:MAG: S-layer protein domain-containing protein [Methanosarcinaceae archaeon]